MAGAAQLRVVPELERQEQVVPAGDHADRGGDPIQRVVVAALLPVIVALGAVLQPLLVVPDLMAGGQPVQVAQRQMVPQRPEPVLGP
jgi:hypothetical protein